RVLFRSSQPGTPTSPRPRRYSKRVAARALAWRDPAPLHRAAHLPPLPAPPGTIPPGKPAVTGSGRTSHHQVGFVGGVSTTVAGGVRVGGARNANRGERSGRVMKNTTARRSVLLPRARR